MNWFSFIVPVAVVLVLFAVILVAALMGIDPTDGLDDVGKRIRKLFGKKNDE